MASVGYPALSMRISCAVMMTSTAARYASTSNAPLRLHEFIGDAHGVIGVLEEDGAVGFRIGRRTVVAFGDQCPSLGFFFGLAIDEVDDIGMVNVEDDHLGGAASLATRLDDAGE